MKYKVQIAEPAEFDIFEIHLDSLLKEIGDELSDFTTQ